MPGFLSKLKKIPSYSSSSTHRHAQRTLVGAELMAHNLRDFNVSAIIPAKFAQVLISLYSAFCKETYACEKMMHGLQGLLALTQTALAISLLISDEKCEDKSQLLCQLMWVLELLFYGVLSAAWLPGEFSKGDKPSASAQQPVVAEVLADIPERSSEESDNDASSLSASPV